MHVYLCESIFRFNMHAHFELIVCLSKGKNQMPWNVLTCRTNFPHYHWTFASISDLCPICINSQNHLQFLLSVFQRRALSQVTRLAWPDNKKCFIFVEIWVKNSTLSTIAHAIFIHLNVPFARIECQRSTPGKVFRSIDWHDMLWQAGNKELTPFLIQARVEYIANTHLSAFVYKQCAPICQLTQLSLGFRARAQCHFCWASSVVILYYSAELLFLVVLVDSQKQLRQQNPNQSICRTRSELFSFLLLSASA